MAETFLTDVDGTWKKERYNSRSEFICDVLRDGIKHPDFNRADLKAMIASEVDIQKRNTRASDEVKPDQELARNSDDERRVELGVHRYSRPTA